MEGSGLHLPWVEEAAGMFCVHHFHPSGKEEKAVFFRPNSDILSSLAPLGGYQTLASLTIFPESSACFLNSAGI